LTVVVKLSGDGGNVVASAAALGIHLRPAHPGNQDPELSSWYLAETTDDNEEAIASTLRSLPGTEAAYSKPEEEPPSVGA
jgi:hypothetical protein